VCKDVSATDNDEQQGRRTKEVFYAVDFQSLLLRSFFWESLWAWGERSERLHYEQRRLKTCLRMVKDL
jgi:hypothetical protein